MTEKQYLKYKPMLHKIANKYRNNSYGVELDDIIQIGVIGMINAVNNYNSNHNMKFDTYMYSCIKWGIQNELRNYKRVKEQYTIISLDHEIEEDENCNLYDIIPNKNINVEAQAIEDITLDEYIEEFKTILPDNQSSLFIDRYVNELSLNDVADKHKLTLGKVRYSLSNSKDKLIKKSYRIRNAYNKYLDRLEDRRNNYINPAYIIDNENKRNSTKDWIRSLDIQQLESDKEYLKKLNII